MLGEIIEHGGDDEPKIQVGDSGNWLPIKVYQDVYHQITGRTEEITQAYKRNLLLEFTDIEQLHYKIKQLCEVHNVIASNETITIFHEKERKEQFKSFAKFKTYNSNNPRPTVNIVLKYNFSIVPASQERAQEYIVNIRLSSRVGLIKKLEEEQGLPAGVFALLTSEVAEVKVEYVDYVIARSFLEAVSEWVDGCETTPKREWIFWLKKWSDNIPQIMRIIFGGLVITFALMALPSVLNNSSSLSTLAKYIIIYMGGFHLIMNLGLSLGRYIENVIDRYTEFSYVCLNKGDEKLAKDFKKGRWGEVLKVVGWFLSSLAIAVLSSKLSSLM